jgi:hypothetical protein
MGQSLLCEILEMRVVEIALLRVETYNCNNS